MEATENSADRCTPMERVSYTNQNRQRGQIDEKYGLGAFVAVIPVSPPATAAVKMQHHLSALAGFSWLSVTVLARQVVTIIVAATLEEAWL
ncbi:hypothetical protein ACOZ4F_01885 [Haloarcula marismortui]|uniref:hypothetical protein n=1 Tax=Haloarcula marismortui TaxID=2238 RepID=UPI003C772B06